jgi:hypothetical protein
MSLILLANFKSFIHMGEDFDDVEAQNIIDGVEASVATHLGYDIVKPTAATVEYHDGDRSNTVLLDHGMVTAVNSVKVDSDWDYSYAETLTFEEDYVWYENGIIQLITGGYFPRRQRYIAVDYDHGYATNPTAITNLPTNVGFTVYVDRAVKVCMGYYAGLAAVVLNSAANGTGITYTESTDYAVMDTTGEVVLIETGAIADGATVYIESGTYSQYSNLPRDIELALKKLMANDYHRSLGTIELESEAIYKIFENKETWDIIDRYARVQV